MSHSLLRMSYPFETLGISPDSTVGLLLHWAFLSVLCVLSLKLFIYVFTLVEETFMPDEPVHCIEKETPNSKKQL